MDEFISMISHTVGSIVPLGHTQSNSMNEWFSNVDTQNSFGTVRWIPPSESCLDSQNNHIYSSRDQYDRFWDD